MQQQDQRGAAQAEELHPLPLPQIEEQEEQVKGHQQERKPQNIVKGVAQPAELGKQRKLKHREKPPTVKIPKAQPLSRQHQKEYPKRRYEIPQRPRRPSGADRQTDRRRIQSAEVPQYTGSHLPRSARLRRRSPRDTRGRRTQGSTPAGGPIPLPARRR